jgi:hypothetical protein
VKIAVSRKGPAGLAFIKAAAHQRTLCGNRQDTLSIESGIREYSVCIRRTLRVAPHPTYEHVT